MTNYLKLAHGGSDPNAVDLYGGPLRIARGGYAPGAGMGDTKWVNDTIHLQAADSAVNIYEAMSAMEDYLDLARAWYTDPVQRDPVWLEFGSTGETPNPTWDVPKRALVRDGAISLAMPAKLPGPFVDGAIFVKLTIQRARWWENYTWEDTAANDFTSSYFWGTEWDLTAESANEGNAAARIAIASAYNFTGNVDQIWIGLRKKRHGITDFDSIWELEDGTAGTDTTFPGSVSGASGSDAAVCTFSGDASLVKRAHIEITDVTGGTDHDHWVGRYLVLLRCKVGSSTECGIKMYHGMRDDISIPSEEVYIDNTDWMLIELGEVVIPPYGYQVEFVNPGIQHFNIALHAERISGAGDLTMDALVLVPSEHLFTASGLYGGAAIPYVYGHVLADGRQLARVADLSVSRIAPPFTMTNWVFPTDPGVAVVQAQATSSHSLTEGSDVELAYVSRWGLYRVR